MENDRIKQRINLAPYRIHSEQERHIVELTASGDFFEMPSPAIDAILALEKGDSPDEIEVQLKKRYPGEEIDMQHFLGQLQEMGFLAENKSDYIIKEETESVSTLGKMLFNPRVRPFYAVFFCANIALFIAFPTSFPHNIDLFPFGSMIANLATAFILSIVLLIIHESGHVLAVKARGLPANVRFGHRLFLIVMETEMTYVWRLNKRERNIPFLAGMCFDQTLLFLTLIATLFLPGIPFFLEAVFGIVIFQLILMTAFQGMIFMKTDLYYVLQNMTGCYNLMENALESIKRRLPPYRGRNKQVIYDGEEKMVGLYSIFAVPGLMLSGFVFVYFIVPQTIYLIKTSVQRIMDPTTSGMVWDSVFVLGQFALMLVLLLFSWHRKYIKKMD